MKKVLRTDNNGYFIEDVILEVNEETPNDCIETLCPEGFYKPKWNGTEWVEGLTQIEIDALNNIPKKLTTDEALSKEVANLRISDMKKNTIINSTLQTIASLKVEIMGLKGGNA